MLEVESTGERDRQYAPVELLSAYRFAARYLVSNALCYRHINVLSSMIEKCIP